MILHTNVLGEGEPIVFLHTGLQTGNTDFEYQREYFRNSYKVILPDLRGHGNSIANDITNFFEECAIDIEETLKNLGIESAHIVGCSLGGLAGLSFAKKYPNKVKSLAISGVLAERPENWLEMHKEESEAQAQLLHNEELIHYFNHLHSSDWKQFITMGQDEEWYPFDLTKDLDGIQSPILYMVGEGNNDESKSAILYQALKEDIHISIIPFASHLVHAQQPKIYTEVLSLFLENVSKDKETV
ncbi:alpha/beta fold hydrolase [Pradoshia sp.]